MKMQCKRSHHQKVDLLLLLRVLVLVFCVTKALGRCCNVGAFICHQPSPCTPQSSIPSEATRIRTRQSPLPSSTSKTIMQMVANERTHQQPKSAGYTAALKDQGAPAVILVRPFLDENVGSCARAMLNFGLWDLRIVAPLCDHSSKMARVRASGADELLENARVFPDIASAISDDLSGVIGTTARQRDMTVRIVSPEEAAKLAVGSLETFNEAGNRYGFMFGPERNGLTNEDLSWATAMLQIPTNSAFSSLNLGQAVQIIGYEYWKARARLGDDISKAYKEDYIGIAKGTRLARMEEIEGLWLRMEEVLDLTELNPDPNCRRLLYDRIKSWLLRSQPDLRDVNALHGALTAVVVKNEKLEGVKERLVKANEGHGRRRSDWRRKQEKGEEEVKKEEVGIEKKEER